MNLLVLILDRKQPENGRLALRFPIDFEQILALSRHHNLGKKTSWLLGVSRTGLDTLLLMVLSTQEKSSEHHSWIKNRDTICSFSLAIQGGYLGRRFAAVPRSETRPQWQFYSVP